MGEYALPRGADNAPSSLAGQVTPWPARSNWALVGAIVGGLLLVRFALKPPRVALSRPVGDAVHPRSHS